MPVAVCASNRIIFYSYYRLARVQAHTLRSENEPGFRPVMIAAGISHVSRGTRHLISRIQQLHHSSHSQSSYANPSHFLAAHMHKHELFGTLPQTLLGELRDGFQTALLCHKSGKQEGQHPLT